tara:strand:- start:680 stop:1687 length:1008 start_codon:yes stop_codon:yes gene_type:complete
MKKKTIVIAEIGPNHNGSLNIAKNLIREAKKSGADYVKFQTFITEEIIIKNAEKASYQKKNSKKNENQYRMLKNLELDFKSFVILKRYAQKQKIKFLTTCFDSKSLKFVKKFNMDYYKIASGEINNFPLIKDICKNAKKVILSTGMSNYEEVKKTINFILNNKIKKKNIVLLHCNTEYPTPLEDVNLNSMVEMSKRLKIDNFGYSDHTLDDIVALSAVSLGAKYIEKHFTLSRKMKGPDHSASMEPKEFKLMVKKIRNIEKILGSKKKFVTKSEKKNRLIARRSIVANSNIRKGEKFSLQNLSIKRPGKGLEPKRIFSLLGKKSKKNYLKDDFIK